MKISLGRKISVQVVPNAKHARVEKTDPDTFKIWVTEPAHEDLANQAVVKLLRKKLRVKSRDIVLLKGQKNRLKTFLIK